MAALDAGFAEVALRGLLLKRWFWQVFLERIAIGCRSRSSHAVQSTFGRTLIVFYKWIARSGLAIPRICPEGVKMRGSLLAAEVLESGGRSSAGRESRSCTRGLKPRTLFVFLGLVASLALAALLAARAWARSSRR